MIGAILDKGQLWRVETGDCLDVMATLPDACIDACVTDPPYGLSFMGKAWDYQVPTVDVWREVFRVLKPGAHLLAFFGTRTYHRGVVAIEDAGFEIRDQIGWLYGSGFPKSLDVGKAIDKAAGAEREVIGTAKGTGKQNPAWNGTAAGRTKNSLAPEYEATIPTTDAAREWDGWGTALKPAWEPVCLARKPFRGTVAANVQEHGTGALNVDGCRIPSLDVIEQSGQKVTIGASAIHVGYDRPNRTMFRTDKPKERSGPANEQGRWPANVIHDGSDEVLEAFPDAPGQLARARTNGEPQNNKIYGPLKGGTKNPEPRRDSGSAARFFYTAKADTAERNVGVQGCKNNHPTVKPADLMRYLCRLVTPLGGIVLDPFTGSGTTGIAAVQEGFRFVGVELSPDYVQIARQRIAAAQPSLFGETDPTESEAPH